MTQANQTGYLPVALIVRSISERLEIPQVPDLPQITQIVNAISLPLIGGLSLLLAKLSIGDAARLAERHFFVTLVVITGVTIRTVIHCDEIWLVHTMTLAMMIIGALVIPSQEAVTAH